MARILIIEEKTDFRELLCRGLETAGHDVTTTGRGVDGLDAQHEQGFDLIFCALFLPDQDGVRVIRQLKMEFPDIRIIAITPGSFDGRLSLQSVAQLVGVGTILPRPFSIRLAVESAEQMLAGSA